jgi:hypothetical protein
MKTFFVSLTGDLLHLYIKYQAESRTAVEQYLERQYKKNGVWTLPWCFIYTDSLAPQSYPHQVPSPGATQHGLHRL